MELIKLQSAHATQYTNRGKKSDWKIQENITNEEMGVLPGILSEAEVFAILDLARKYELNAFNVGIEYGKNQQNKLNYTKLNHLERRIELAREENERLAKILDDLTNRKG